MLTAAREPLREDFVQETEFLQTLADIPEEIKEQMGYQQNEFILECSFAGKECQERFDFCSVIVFVLLIYARFYYMQSYFEGFGEIPITKKPMITTKG